MKKHMGWGDAKDDYVVLDGEKSVGRIYKEHSRHFKQSATHRGGGHAPFWPGALPPSALDIAPGDFALTENHRRLMNPLIFK
jgi:hypothetical protein